MRDKVESIERMLSNEKIRVESGLKNSHLTGQNENYLKGRLVEIKSCLNHLQEILKTPEPEKNISTEPSVVPIASTLICFNHFLFAKGYVDHQNKVDYSQLIIYIDKFLKLDKPKNWESLRGE